MDARGQGRVHGHMIGHLGRPLPQAVRPSPSARPADQFSKDGFGYVALLPGNDAVSRLAMKRRMDGGKFEFMDKSSKGILHPVAFGCHRTRGNERRLHSHLGKAFAGNYAINKCRHMCFGQCFTWVTDCYALKFILSYDGHNSAILCLQMCFMCWDMDIEYRNDIHLTDADYWSRLGADICYDPLLKDYIERADFSAGNFRHQLHFLCCQRISHITSLLAICSLMPRHLLLRCSNSMISSLQPPTPPKSYLS
jgi:hypothetical protein